MLVVNEPDRKFVSNPTELRIFCAETIRYLHFIEAYTKKCLTEIGKNTALVLLYPIKNQYKQLCKSGKTSKKALQLMKAASCANAVKPNLQNCTVKIIDAFDGIAYQAPDQLKIPMFCW